MNRVARDVKERRNLDIYASVLAAFVVSLLGALEVVPDDKVPPLILAVLAIQIFNSLATRDLVQQRFSDEVLRKEFDPELIRKRERSKKLYLVGVSLSRTIDTSFDGFRDVLSSGGEIRIVLTSPEADDAALDARSQASRPEIEDIRAEIRSSLKRLAALKRQAKHGSIEVKLTGAALHFGANYIDFGLGTAELHVQHYSFRLGGESRPIMVLRPRDGEWFECYRRQLEALWEDAEPHDLDQTTGETAAVPPSP
jgi:hypothetical protein